VRKAWAQRTSTGKELARTNKRQQPNNTLPYNRHPGNAVGFQQDPELTPVGPTPLGMRRGCTYRQACRTTLTIHVAKTPDCQLKPPSITRGGIGTKSIRT